MTPVRRAYIPPFQASILALLLGVVLLIGGPDRISGPSYTTVVATGGEVVWGVGFLVLSLIFWVCSKIIHWGLFQAYMTAATAYLLLAVALADAARSLDTAGLTGVVVYGWVAWVHVLAAASIGEGRLARKLTSRLASGGDDDAASSRP